MGDVLPFGGKRYEPPQNLEERKELFDTIKDLSTARFRQFIKKNIPELITAGWLEKTDEELVLLMHEIRSQYIGLGEDFIISRNILRARQFSYCPVEIPTKPRCVSCKWFRVPPPNEEFACMHLGTIPQDLACRGYEGNT